MQLYISLVMLFQFFLVLKVKQGHLAILSDTNIKQVELNQLNQFFFHIGLKDVNLKTKQYRINFANLGSFGHKLATQIFIGSTYQRLKHIVQNKIR